MSPRRVTLAALLVLPLALAGCKINSINYFPPKAAHVRAVNVVADAPVLDISAGDAATWSGVAFEGSTDYVDLDNASTTFSAKAPSATSPLVQGTFSLAGEQTYTLITYGTTAAPAFVLLPDATIQPGSGRSQLRVVEVATGIGTIDVYLTTPGLAIDTLSPNFGGVDYNGATAYLQFPSGTYQLRITGTGTKTVIYDSGSRAFSDNTSTDLIVYARTSGTLPNALLLDVNGAGQRVVANNTLANVRFMHAAPQAGNINVLVDGTALFSDLAYPQPTGYSTVTAATHTVTFEATATPGSPIASVTPTFAPASDSSIFVSGLAGSTHAVVLSDNNLPPQSGNAKFRFVNASIGVGALDVLINNVKQVSALAPDTASGYIELAAGTYTIAFSDPATGVVRATLSGVTATDTQTNSVYAYGTADALAGVVVQDD
ncbi:MAG TPA: DUF4397 domain-containing protein [Casimicrobiaceae bacterium]